VFFWDALATGESKLVSTFVEVTILGGTNPMGSSEASLSEYREEIATSLAPLSPAIADSASEGETWNLDRV